MERFYSTREVAARLGIKISKLMWTVWSKKIPEPTRAPGGSRLWAETDIKKAEEILKTQPEPHWDK